MDASYSPRMLGLGVDMGTTHGQYIYADDTSPEGLNRNRHVATSVCIPANENLYVGN